MRQTTTTTTSPLKSATLWTLWLWLVLSSPATLVQSFTAATLSIRTRASYERLHMATPPQDVTAGVLETIADVTPSDEWELDCYSRPVVNPDTRKKLWEVLICDSTGSFRYSQELPSNQVNSKTLRGIVEQLMDRADEDDNMSKPSQIRFFRGAMFNMINIALKELPDVTAKPSRCVSCLAAWLEERHATVYPQRPGYNAQMMAGGGAGGAPFLNVRTPIKLPDALRGEKYAFVALPLAEFLPGGGVNADTVGVGRLCPLPAGLPAGDTFVQGIVILTRRANALATWLAGTELVALQCDLRQRRLTLDTDIDTTHLMARLDDQQRKEGAAFETGKEALQGLHFLSVQQDDESDPAGFWLLRELPLNI